jgi:hypothetical protein
MKHVLAVLCILVFLSGVVFAAGGATKFMLASDLAPDSTTVVLAQATTLSPPLGLYIDREYMGVAYQAADGVTFMVQRPQGVKASHLAGAAVWVGPPEAFSQQGHAQQGSCSGLSPVLITSSGDIRDCVAGQWVLVGNAIEVVTKKADGTIGVGSTALDPVNGVTTPKITAPVGTPLTASGVESTPPLLPLLPTLFLSSVAHLPQFTKAGNSTIDGTMVAPHDCGVQFVKTVATDGTVTCAASVGFNIFDSATAYWKDEFGVGKLATGGIGELSWTFDKFATNNCVLSNLTGLVNHPGILKMVSGTSSGDGCALGQFDTPDGNTPPWGNIGSTGNGNWEIQTVFYTSAAAVSNTAYAIGTSLNGTTYRNNDSVLIRYDTSAVTCTGTGNNVVANWVYETLVGGTATCVDSGVPVVVGTWYWARIVSVAGVVSMKIGTAPSALSSVTSIGSGTTANQGPIVQVITRTTVANSLAVDRWAAQFTGLTR